MRYYGAPLIAAVVLSAVSASSFVVPKSSHRRQAPVNQNLDHLGAPAAPQGAEGGLWRTDGSFQSNLIIKNVLEITSITVSPVLYMADGTEYDLAPVQLDSSGTATININTALHEAPSGIQAHISSFGTAAIGFQWSWASGVVATVYNIDETRSLVYSFPLTSDTVQAQSASATQSSRELESMWWKIEPNVTGFIALTNASLNEMTATVAVFNSGGRAATNNTITLPSHSTNMVDIGSMWNQLPSGSMQGGIRISYVGGPDSLAVHGGLEDTAKGYSQSLGFSPRVVPAPGEAAPTAQLFTLSSPGIMVGTQDSEMQFPKNTQFAPYEVLRNTGNQPMQVQLAANYMNGTTPTDISLGTLTLAVQEVQQVDLASRLTAAGLGQFNGYLNLETSFTGVPRNLLVATGSIDQTQSYVFEVAASRKSNSNAKVFCYWNVAGDTDTMLSIWNQATKDQDFILTFFHREGQYQLPIHLAANASTTLNFATIIKQGTPDAQGNVIPSDIIEGSVKLSGANGDQSVIQVSTSVAIFNVRTATCSAPCSHCIGVIGDPWTVASSAAIAISHTSSSVAAKIMYDNSLTVDETESLTWYVDNTNIATVGSYPPQVTGVAIGKANLMAYPTNPDGIVDGGGESGCKDVDGDGWGCNMASPEWDCPITVTPRIIFNGTDITGTTQSVVAGQQIGLSASYTLAGDDTFASQTWSLGGTTIGNYTASSSGATVTSVSGFSSDSITFYWVINGSSILVSYSLNLVDDPNIYTASANFNVSTPTPSTPTVANYGLLTVDQFTGCSGVANGYFLVYGLLAGPVPPCSGNYTGTAGILFTPPSATTPSGNYTFVQIINSDTVTYTGHLTCTATGGLDGAYPYQGKTGVQVGDSPFAALPYSPANRSFNATMYLMWQSTTAGSITVPLGSVTWAFSGTATLSGSTWGATGSGTAGSFVAATGSGSYPTWTGLAVPPNNNCH